MAKRESTTAGANGGAKPRRRRIDGGAARASAAPPPTAPLASSEPAAGSAGDKPDTFAARADDKNAAAGRAADRPGAAAYAAAGDASDSRSDSMASEPSEHDIRMRAYERYLERGGGHGMDFEDWLEAERELKNRRG